MKIVITILSSIVFIPIFLITLIAGSAKFQLLNPNFWINSFEKHNTYKNIQAEVIKYVENKNAQTITELITVENVKDFTNRNTVRIVRFLNGSEGELTFYIPIQKIPEGLIPKRLGDFSEEMTATMLIQKFNISGVDLNTINKFKSTGKNIDKVFLISLPILVIVTYLASPVIFICMGIVLIAQNFLVQRMDLHGNPIINSIFTPVFLDISTTWFYFGITLTLLGIALLGVKSYIIQKNG